MKRLFLLAIIVFLVGCSDGNNNYGVNRVPLKAICQTCTYNNECESNDCRLFSSGEWRCVPYHTGPGYICPIGQYKKWR